MQSTLVGWLKPGRPTRDGVVDEGNGENGGRAGEPAGCEARDGDHGRLVRRSRRISEKKDFEPHVPVKRVKRLAKPPSDSVESIVLTALIPSPSPASGSTTAESMGKPAISNVDAAKHVRAALLETGFEPILRQLIPRRDPILPPDTMFGRLDKPYMLDFRTLNQVVLPLSYPTAFYHDTLDVAEIESVSWGIFVADQRPGRRSKPGVERIPVLMTNSRRARLGIRHSESGRPGELVAAIRCILIPEHSHVRGPVGQILYISTLATYAAHRSRGFATALIGQAIESGCVFLRQREQANGRVGDEDPALSSDRTNLKATGDTAHDENAPPDGQTNDTDRDENGTPTSDPKLDPSRPHEPPNSEPINPSSQPNTKHPTPSNPSNQSNKTSSVPFKSRLVTDHFVTVLQEMSMISNQNSGTDETEVEMGAKLPIRKVIAHVWIGNEEALDFYTKLGFQSVSVIKGYYPSLDPSDGVMIEKILR